MPPVFNETQASETNNLKVTIGALKLAGRIIPHAKHVGIGSTCYPRGVELRSYVKLIEHIFISNAINLTLLDPLLFSEIPHH